MRSRMSDGSLVRPIALLAAAAFASIATMRVADPLVPQVALDFAVSVGDAAVITTAFALAYGVCQLFYGVLGDRFGKYRLVTLATFVSAGTVACAGLARSLDALAAVRLISGASAGAIVPLALAFIGDHVPYRDRQAVLGRFLTGTILGIVAGQVFGGVLGEFLGWRAAFLLLGMIFLLVGFLLALELRSGRVPPPPLAGPLSLRTLGQSYHRLLRRRWVWVVLATVFIEAFLFYGALTFIGAYLHSAFGLDYATIGLTLACLGIGGLTYALAVRRFVALFGERGLSLVGSGLLTLGFVAVALGPLALITPAVSLLGLGLHMLHNTLQTNATQMAPEARGLAVSTFANALFMGQAGGVWVAGHVVDRIGYAPVFLSSAGGLLVVGIVFAILLGHRPAEG
jgi:YNFM family putative membrane transporter